MAQLLDGHTNEFFTRHASTWQLVKTSWASEQRFFAYLFFAIVMFMTLTLVTLNIVYNYLYYYFYYELYDVSELTRIFIVSSLLASAYILIGFYRFYLTQMFSLRWLEALCTAYLLKRKAVMRLHKKQIKKEVSTIIHYAVEFSLHLLGVITTFIFFMYILVQLSGDLEIGGLTVPYYLVWLGALYSLTIFYFTVKLHRPLIVLNMLEQALACPLTEARWHQKVLIWLSQSYNQAILLLPLFIAWPNFFDKVYLFGGLVQCLYAFGGIQKSLAKMMTAYEQIGK